MGPTNLEDMRHSRDMFKMKKIFLKSLNQRVVPAQQSQNRGNCPMPNNTSINISVTVNINLTINLYSLFA